jgi:hypothetical protein
MTESITINTERLIRTLTALRESHLDGLVLTTDIIDHYMGGFHSNLNVPVQDSWNAQFGKYLKAHASELRIMQVDANVRVEANGHPTSAAKWQIT